MAGEGPRQRRVRPWPSINSWVNFLRSPRQWPIRGTNLRENVCALCQNVCSLSAFYTLHRKPYTLVWGFEGKGARAQQKCLYSRKSAVGSRAGSGPHLLKTLLKHLLKNLLKNWPPYPPNPRLGCWVFVVECGVSGVRGLPTRQRPLDVSGSRIYVTSSRSAGASGLGPGQRPTAPPPLLIYLSIYLSICLSTYIYIYI